MSNLQVVSGSTPSIGNTGTCHCTWLWIDNHDSQPGSHAYTAGTLPRVSHPTASDFILCVVFLPCNTCHIHQTDDFWMHWKRELSKSMHKEKKREKGLGHRSISLCGILRVTQWSLCYCLRDIFKERERKAEENGGTEGTGGIKVLQLYLCRVTKKRTANTYNRLFD